MSLRLCFLLSLFWAAQINAAPDRYGVLHEERSLYTRILVHQNKNLLCLKVYVGPIGQQPEL